MAQIIKHRRGSLESVVNATKRAGELLVITGSSGIEAANGNSILFVGIDGSTATAANKFLQGTSNPDLTGENYDTSVDGIPFYNTQEEKLYILNKGGNIEVKSTPNTGGTGIVSSSAQVSAFNTFLEIGGDSVVSGSSQITIGDTTGFATFSSSLADIDVAFDGRLNNIELFTASEETKNSTLATLTGSYDSRFTTIEATTASQDTRITDLESFSSSLDTTFASDAELSAVSAAFDTTIDNLDTDDVAEGSNLYYTDARVKTKLDADGVVSSSAQIVLNDADKTGFDTDDVAEGSNLYYTDVRVKTKLDTETVVSGSAQVVSLLENQATDFGTGRVSGDNFGDVEGTSNFTGSFSGDGSGLTGLVSDLRISGSTGNDVVSLLNDDLSVVGTSNEIETSVTDGQIQIGIVENPTLSGNVTISGNLQVEGTTTTVDSTTVNIGDNIVELNGTGAAFGGLMIGDVTAPNKVSGSLLWDATNDYWIAGPLDSESKILLAGGDSVVSGSAQITIGDTTGYVAFSQSLEATDDALSARASALEAFSASEETKNSTLETVTASFDNRIGSIETTTASFEGRLDNIELTSASHEGRLDSIESFTSSFESSIKTKLDEEQVVSSSAQISAYGVFAELGGDGLVTSSEQVVSLIDSQDVNLGGISGSSLDITGNAKIDGNITIGGNLQLGDAATDTISFAGDVSSDILPDSDNTHDLGSATDRFAEVHAANLYGAVNATNNVVSGSSDTSTVDITITNGTISADVIGGVVSGSSQLDNTTVVGFTLTNVEASGSFSGSFVGDGSGLTGLVTDLSISGSTGDDTVDLLNDALSFDGGTAVSTAVTDNTVTINVQDASTAQKGISSFVSDDFSVSSGEVSIKDGGVRAVNINSDVAGTGISKNGVDDSLEVDYGSTAGTAVEGNTSLTVAGTTNEIEVTDGSVTLGSGGTVTIGLPDDVTIGNDLTVTNDATVNNDLTIVGNLYVQGTTTTVDSTTVQIGDNILDLNVGGSATTAGLLVTDVTAPNTVSGSLLWDATNDYWTAGAQGSEREIARIETASLSENKVLKANADGLLVNTTITDDGTDVSITGDMTINGLAAANSFVYADGDKTLQAVQPSNAGDLIQWNGSSFIASNEIDGGTF